MFYIMPLFSHTESAFPSFLRVSYNLIQKTTIGKLVFVFFQPGLISNPVSYYGILDDSRVHNIVSLFLKKLFSPAQYMLFLFPINLPQ